MNLERFFIYDVFFFGTARKIDSHISERSEGMFRCMVAGSDIDGIVRTGRWSCLETRDIL